MMGMDQIRLNFAHKISAFFEACWHEPGRGGREVQIGPNDLGTRFAVPACLSFGTERQTNYNFDAERAKHLHLLANPSGANGGLYKVQHPHGVDSIQLQTG
jgi:hypothetical protein